MLMSAAPLVKEAGGQQTWIDLALPDLRTLAREFRSAVIDEVKRADDAQGALKILLAHFGFIDEAKNDMLVVVDVRHGHVLWNFMHAPARAMNRHRQGELLYKRYVLQDKQKGEPVGSP
ncbi:hypothetical protein CP336_02815 [Pseudomonas fluorescens]|nr:hypothetical protein CP336_02815 [Pseudomonas fluorescens]